VTEIKTNCIYIHAVPHREHILMGILVCECCTWRQSHNNTIATAGGTDGYHYFQF